MALLHIAFPLPPCAGEWELDPLAWTDGSRRTPYPCQVRRASRQHAGGPGPSQLRLKCWTLAPRARRTAARPWPPAPQGYAAWPSRTAPLPLWRRAVSFHAAGRFLRAFRTLSRTQSSGNSVPCTYLCPCPNARRWQSRRTWTARPSPWTSCAPSSPKTTSATPTSSRCAPHQQSTHCSWRCMLRGCLLARMRLGGVRDMTVCAGQACIRAPCTSRRYQQSQ